MSLELKQQMPLYMKVILTKKRITDFANILGWENVYIAFSGGKDSTVLLHIARELYNFEAVFADTGLEYPEIKEFVKSQTNMVIVKPKLSFKEVIDKYGYPVISKKIAMGVSRYRNTKSDLQKELRLYGGINPTSGKKQNPTISKKWHYLIDAPFKISEQCCEFSKKEPLKTYQKKTKKFPLIGIMADEGNQRKMEYKKNGCIYISEKQKQCRPLMFWTEEDIWEYIKIHKVDYCKVYDTGVKRTGCIFCMFGVHMEKGENRFQKLYKSHYQLWKYCMDTLGIREVLEFINVKTGGESE